MFLWNQYAKMSKFSHPMGQLDLPAGLPEPRLKELTTKLMDRTITKQERDELAESQIRLAMTIVGRYLRRSSKRHKDIMVAEAMFAIALALEQAPDKMTGNNLTNYIASKVHTYVANAISNKRRIVDQMVGVPLSDKNLPPKRDNLRDLQETLASCIETDLEREVVRLRGMGYTDLEIGQMLDYTKVRINQVRRGLEKRFNKAATG